MLGIEPMLITPKARSRHHLAGGGGGSSCGPETPRAMPIAGTAPWVLPLELLQEFDYGLLIFGAQLAEPPDDLARVTPIGLRG